MTVFVSNPVKQHTNHLLRSFKFHQIPFIFFTSFWTKDNFLFKILRNFSSQLHKREDLKLENKDIILIPIFSLFSLFMRVLPLSLEIKSFIIDRVHDSFAKKILEKGDYQVVIGYEKSALMTFKAAKQKGIITVLDLAQVHVNFIEQLRSKYPFFVDITGSNFIFNKIKSIKLQEYELADYILVLSEFAKKTLMDSGVPEAKIRIIHLGFEPESFTPKETYEQKTDKNLELLYVGSISKRKGVPLLIKLLEENSELPVNLTLVGSEGDAADLLQANSKIKYLPFMKHSELAEIQKKSDIFVFPSYLDSWAMVVVDAMASGLPVIVTSNTGSSELVTKDNGFVVEAGNLEEVKNKIIYFIEHRDKISEMGKASRKQVEDLTWNRYYSEAAEFIKNITHS